MRGSNRAFVLLAAAAGAGNVFGIEAPASIRQGETIRVRIECEAADGLSARFAKRTVPLFRGPDGRCLGLMPVEVVQPPGKHRLEVTGAKGEVLDAIDLEVLDAGFPRQNIRVSAQMSSLRPLPGEVEAIQALRETLTPKRLWKEPFLTPTRDCMNSPFGVLRFHNGKYTGNYHRGVDLRSPKGRPVRATAAGVVKISRMYRLHGGTVGLDHGQGVTSIYIHLSRLNVKPGATVRRGDVIGFVGATGFATGPHLHWGLYVNGVSVNPGQWMAEVRRCE